MFANLRRLLGFARSKGNPFERDVSDFSRYLAAGDVNAAHPESGWTLLHNASELGYLPLIEALVKVGANLNVRDTMAGRRYIWRSTQKSTLCASRAKDWTTLSFLRYACCCPSVQIPPSETSEAKRFAIWPQAYGIDVALQYDRLTSRTNPNPHARA
jgi:hypothetical protein